VSALGAFLAAVASAIPAEVWTAIGAALVGAVTTWLNGRRNRRRGRTETLTELEELDREEAAEIRERLDRIDRDSSAVERLRRLGKWRG